MDISRIFSGGRCLPVSSKTCQKDQTRLGTTMNNACLELSAGSVTVELLCFDTKCHRVLFQKGIESPHLQAQDCGLDSQDKHRIELFPAASTCICKQFS